MKDNIKYIDNGNNGKVDGWIMEKLMNCMNNIIDYFLKLQFAKQTEFCLLKEIQENDRTLYSLS